MTTATTKAKINRFIARHEVAWELTFGALAIFFVTLGFIEPADPAQLRTVVVVEWIITGIYALEFFGRLWAAPVRRAYFRDHLVDLVSVVPPGRWLRPFRLLRLLRLVRTFAGVSRAMAHTSRLATHRGLIWIIGAWAAVTVLASLGLYISEQGVNKAVENPFDALWWGVVTLSTVGYGDIIPVTAEGRVSAILLMVLGVGLFSAITAAITSFFISSGREDSLVSDLERLVQMRDAGTLTSEEFAAAKGLILSNGSKEDVAELAS